MVQSSNRRWETEGNFFFLAVVVGRTETRLIWWVLHLFFCLPLLSAQGTKAFQDDLKERDLPGCHQAKEPCTVSTTSPTCLRAAY